MRWAIKHEEPGPVKGAIRYRIRFAWTPVKTAAVGGESVSWDAEMIWLEKVVEVQEYWRYAGERGRWEHNRWYPLNEFTISLYEHNNQ